MGSAIAKVLIVILIIGYCVLFIQWNGEPTWVRGVDAFGVRCGYTLPLGWWLLGSAAVGVVVMAIFASGEWGAQKRRTAAASAQVARAKAKLQELADMIKQQRQEIAQLKGGAAEQPKEQLSPSEADEEAP